MLTLFLFRGRKINSQKLKNSFRCIKESLHYLLCHYGLSDDFWKCFEWNVEHLWNWPQVRSGLPFSVFPPPFFLLCILNRSICLLFQQTYLVLEFSCCASSLLHQACCLYSTSSFKHLQYTEHGSCIDLRYNPCSQSYPTDCSWWPLQLGENRLSMTVPIFTSENIWLEDIFWN